MRMESLKLSQIEIGFRYRTDLGDVDELAQSIKELGQLQPIAVMIQDGVYKLLDGRRRLAAHEKMGAETIYCAIMEPGEVDAKLYARQVEQATDLLHKPWSLSERAAIATAMTKYISEKRGVDKGVAPVTMIQTPMGEVRVEAREKTRDIVAEAVGFSSAYQMQAAQAVVASGDDILIKAMDTGEITPSKALNSLKPRNYAKAAKSSLGALVRFCKQLNLPQAEPHLEALDAILKAPVVKCT